ncbi:MAG: sialidase family protein [Acidobacteriota bacterium]
MQGTALLVAAATLLYGWAFTKEISRSGELEHPRFSTAFHPGPETPLYAERFITAPLGGPGMIHSPSICETKSGNLVAAWYGGSREGATDVAVYGSTLESGKDNQWSEPRRIVDADSASRELRRYVRKVGNSVVFSGKDGPLWLLYVSIAVGGWSGSSLNVKSSSDDGVTWTPSTRLTLSPFFNVSELVRSRPLSLESGGFAVPIYHELLGQFCEILWLLPDGSAPETVRWTKTRMTDGKEFIQPSIAPLDDLSAVALYRTVVPGPRLAGFAGSADGGLHWNAPRRASLLNPGSSLSVLTLSGGRLLVAFNDTRQDRENLRLAVSTDLGETWTNLATLEAENGKEFSYPYMIRDREGLIHLVYSWQRERVKHVSFNEAWIDARLREATPEGR